MSLPSMGAGRWSSRRLCLVATVVAVSALAPGCGRATEETRAVADEALSRIDGLEARVDQLEAEIEKSRGRLKDAREFKDRLVRDVNSLARQLDRSLDGLGAAVSDVRSTASDGAAAAVAEAQGVARELGVLEQRYDYHLRRYHGGGG